jgi:hypothetical protein
MLQNIGKFIIFPCQTAPLEIVCQGLSMASAERYCLSEQNVHRIQVKRPRKALDDLAIRQAPVLDEKSARQNRKAVKKPHSMDRDSRKRVDKKHVK